MFDEFEYFIKRIQKARNGQNLPDGEYLEDLEIRFRLQVENGLVIHDAENQELAMEALLLDIPDSDKNMLIQAIRHSRLTGELKDKLLRKDKAQMPKATRSNQALLESSLDLFCETLRSCGLRIQRQPLGVKMLHAAHALPELDLNDERDVKLLFVKTCELSGHAKKTDPVMLARSLVSSLQRQ